MMHTKTTDRRVRFTGARYFAAFILLVLAGFLVFYAKRCWVWDDEFLYYTFPQRLAKGDRLLGDELSFIQFVAIFFYPPYRLFTAVTGGTEGLVLFMRLWYVALVGLLFLLLCLALRERKYAAVIAAFFFCVHPLAEMPAMNYYNISTHTLAAACVLLLLPEERRSAPKLILAGIFLSCAVVAEPPLAALYALYSLLVLLRRLKKKKPFAPSYAFLLDGRVWKWLSVGVGISAVVFLVFLFIYGDVKSLPDTVSMMIYGNPFDLNPVNGSRLAIIAQKAAFIFSAFGTANCILFLLTPAAVCAARVYCKKRGVGFRKAGIALFLLAAGLFISCQIYTMAVFNRSDAAQQAIMRPATFPVLMFSLTAYLLCGKRDKKMFALWIVSVLASVLIDAFSNFSLLTCCGMAYFPALFCTVQFLRENFRTRGESGDGRGQRTVFRAAAAVCCICVCLQAAQVFTLLYDMGLKTDGSPDALVISELGTTKGIRIPKAHADFYKDVIADLREIKKNYGGPIYIVNSTPALYLESDLPLGTYCAWDGYDRSLGSLITDYWKLRPAQRPSFIYCPLQKIDGYSVNNIDPQELGLLRGLRALCDSRTTEGSGGYIMEVLKWHD